MTYCEKCDIILNHAKDYLSKPNDKCDLVCAGGMKLPHGCDDYEIGFCAYMDEVLNENLTHRFFCDVLSCRILRKLDYEKKTLANRSYVCNINNN